MVPQNASRAELIEKCYGDKAKKVTRYAIKKEMDIFDVEKLQQAVDSLQPGYALKKMEEEIYEIFKLADKFSDDVSPVKPLEGKTVVLFFPESSIRTRVTFEKGIHELGGKTILFPPEALEKRKNPRCDRVFGKLG